MARLKLFIVCVVVAILAILAFQNRDEVTVDLLTYALKLPLTLLILIVGLLGFAAGVIFGARIPRRLQVNQGTEPTAEKTENSAESS